MNNRNYLYLVIIIIAIFIGIHIYLVYNSPPKTDKTLLDKIDKLELKIESLSKKQDSIKYLILNIEDSIEENEKTHEQISNIIINNPDSVNRKFVDEYIRVWKANQ